MTVPTLTITNFGTEDGLAHEDGDEDDILAEFVPNRAATLAGQRKTKLTVLLVEDDEADAFLILEALNHSPHVDQVITATDGTEALEALAAGAKPDVAIVDLNMPKIGGFSLLREFRAGEPDSFPVIVMTSSRSSEDAYRSYRRGAWLAASKPKQAERYASFLNSAFADLTAHDGISPRRRKIVRWRFLNAA